MGFTDAGTCFYVPVVSLWPTCLLLRVWATDKQHWQSRELEKYGLSDPIQDLLSQNLQSMLLVHIKV